MSRDHDTVSRHKKQAPLCVFRLCDNLPGFGGLIGVGLFEGLGLGLVGFFEELVAGYDLFQRLGLGLGLFEELGGLRAVHPAQNRAKRGETVFFNQHCRRV